MKKIIIVWDSIEIGGVDKYLYNLLISNKFQKNQLPYSLTITIKLRNI